MASPLHQKVGEILVDIQKCKIFKRKKIKVILDPECAKGSKPEEIHRIPLFIGKPNNATGKKKERKSEYELCNVDAMIIEGKKIKVIIEIEESNNTPTQIYGKYYTSNMAEYYLYDDKDDKFPKEIKLDRSSIFFIQIIDKKSFRPNSAKPAQLEKIEKAINDLNIAAKKYEFSFGCVKKYKIIQIDGSKIGDTKSFDDFKKELEEAFETK